MTNEATAPSAIDTAAEWFARKRSGAMSAQELCELQVWLDETEEHSNAFRLIMRAWEMSGLAGTDPEMLAIREAARGERPVRKRYLQAALGGLCAFALVGGSWFAYRSGAFAEFFTPVWEANYQTAIGQTRTVTLHDGSVVSLDTDTTLRVREDGSERLVELERGQAFFHVAKDRVHPFVVNVNGSTVTATGTRFDVRAAPNLFKVILLEGSVRVETPPSIYGPAERADLKPGWQFTDSLDDISIAPIGEAAAERETAWLTGHIAVVAAPLSAVVAELNRYSSRKILVTQAVAQKEIDGVFRTGDVDGFVNLVRHYKLARVISDTPEAIVLDSPKKSRHEAQ